MTSSAHQLMGRLYKSAHGQGQVTASESSLRQTTPREVKVYEGVFLCIPYRIVSLAMRAHAGGICRTSTSLDVSA